MTPIDVLDSAVKIGLGAVISAFVTYWLARANHYRTIEKEFNNRKREMLESVAEQVAVFDQFALRYWQTVANWLQDAPPGEPMSAAKLEEIKKLEDEVSDGYGRLRLAMAKLELYDELESKRLLVDYGNNAKTYPISEITNRKVSKEHLQKYRMEFKQRREELFAELAAACKRTVELSKSRISRIIH